MGDRTRISVVGIINHSPTQQARIAAEVRWARAPAACPSAEVLTPAHQPTLRIPTGLLSSAVPPSGPARPQVVAQNGAFELVYQGLVEVDWQDHKKVRQTAC